MHMKSVWTELQGRHKWFIYSLNIRAAKPPGHIHSWTIRPHLIIQTPTSYLTVTSHLYIHRIKIVTHSHSQIFTSLFIFTACSHRFPLCFQHILQDFITLSATLNKLWTEIYMHQISSILSFTRKQSYNFKTQNTINIFNTLGFTSIR